MLAISVIQRFVELLEGQPGVAVWSCEPGSWQATVVVKVILGSDSEARQCPRGCGVSREDCHGSSQLGGGQTERLRRWRCSRRRLRSN